MFPPDGTPLAARLARGADWWFTPRWRALLTWLALVVITAAVLDAIWFWFAVMTQQPIAYLNRLLGAKLPPVFNGIAFRLTLGLLRIWFQPLALRLSLRRGLAWIGFPLVAEILTQFLWSGNGHQNAWTLPTIYCGSAALQCLVLRGWRSRPWMCLPAQAATSALRAIAPLHHFDLWYRLAWAVSALSTAALLLYGTRLLRPEERAPKR